MRKPLFKLRIEEWIEDCGERMLGAKTIREYRKRISIFHRFGKERGWPSDPTKITALQVRDFYEAHQYLASNTQKDLMAVVVQFLRFCRNPIADKLRFRIRPARTRVNWLSEAEVGTAIASAHYPELRAMLVMLAYTGIRAGELRSLRLRDIDARSMQIKGKGGKSRVIPLTREFWEAIGPYYGRRMTLGGSDMFLVHTRKGRVAEYSEEGLRLAVTNHMRKLGLKASPHTFRRSFGRHRYKRGCPIVELSYLMGHSSIEQTVAYLGINELDIESAMQQYQPDYLQNREKVYLLGQSQTVR